MHGHRQNILFAGTTGTRRRTIRLHAVAVPDRGPRPFVSCRGHQLDAVERKHYLKLPADVLLSQARTRLPALLKFGVGTVRDAGDKDGVGLALAAEAKRTLEQLTTAPWIDSPGAAFHHRGRYGAFMGEPIEDHDSAAACVADRVRAGADRIKLLVSGIIDFRAGARHHSCRKCRRAR